MPHGNPVLQFLGILILTTHKVNPKGPRWSAHSLSNSNSFSPTTGTGVYNSFLDFTPSGFCISSLLAMLQLGEWGDHVYVLVGKYVSMCTKVTPYHTISGQIWVQSPNCMWWLHDCQQYAQEFHAWLMECAVCPGIPRVVCVKVISFGWVKVPEFIPG